MTDRPFPSFPVRLFLIAYRVLWLVGMPLALFYLYRRGRRDPLYGRHLGERFGRHARRETPHVWVHAVSLGELRSAVPLIEALLARGERIVTTHFTPAGRREAEKVFATAIAEGRLSAVYVPFDYALAFRRFFAAFRPKYGLVMEVEFWPGMIMAARAQGVPLFLCNGQYPTRSYEKDRQAAISRADIVPGFAGVMVKSETQAERFRELGLARIAITGEMRFEQPMPAAQIAAAEALRPRLAGDRPVITFASVTEGEDALFLRSIEKVLEAQRSAGTPPPLFVCVPRAPERFGEVGEMITSAGLAMARRSEALGDDLVPVALPEGIDVLLGDSLGEMAFYLSLCDEAVIGGGFVPKGSHNISEPLALRKPVIVGPEIWTIEYPAVEAMAAGVCRQVTPEGLTGMLIRGAEGRPSEEDIDRFFETFGGSVEKTLAAIDTWRTD